MADTKDGAMGLLMILLSCLISQILHQESDIVAFHKICEGE
jgi:hypothetical protein